MPLRLGDWGLALTEGDCGIGSLNPPQVHIEKAGREGPREAGSGKMHLLSQKGSGLAQDRGPSRSQRGPSRA